MSDQRHVMGFCPACGQDTLFLGHGGRVTCARLACSRPTAADEILGMGEVAHIVSLRANGYSMQHPMVERLDGKLFDCALGTYLDSLEVAPAAPGRYRAIWEGQDWVWELLA